MTATPTRSELDALKAQAEDNALDLVNNHLADIYNAPEGSVEATVRLLAARGLLTTPELQSAEAAQTINLNRVFNHIPKDKHEAEVRRHRRYVEALERATHVLAAQLDAVCALAAAKKTVTGKTAAEQNEHARGFLEKARKAWDES
jgi:hypothetical protein